MSTLTAQSPQATHEILDRDPYLVKSIVHSSKLLSAFRSAGETLPLCEIAARSGLPKTMAFRLVYTLSKCGLVEKVSNNLYRSCIRPHKEKRHKFGYAGEGTDPFSIAISRDLKDASAAADIELICLDNRGSAKVAQRNTEFLIREKVDLAFQLQTDEHIAPVISAKYRDASIPVIALEVPHPGAVYYGANNHEAGRAAGRHLGLWAKQHWLGKLDEVVLLEFGRAGEIPRMRLSSMTAELKAVLPQMENCPVRYMDGDGRFETSFELMRKHLQNSHAQRLAVGAINDASALGALRAFQEAGRTDCCAVMAENSSPEGRAEMRKPDTRLIGSVAFFPEKYGSDLVRVALDLLNQRQLPSAIFVKHKLITPKTVDHYYPYDQLDCFAQTVSVLI